MVKKTAYNDLMREVSESGWCGSVVDDEVRHVDFFIPERGRVTATQFVDWLFLADGMDPGADLHKWQKHKDRLRQAFASHMGSEVVDASQLKWHFD
jgi:hypothetical protein